MRFTVPAIGACVALGLALVAVLGSGAAPAALNKAAAPAALNKAAAPKATVISVTAGKPSELAFKLSKSSSITAGTITFKVTNMGVAYHNFEICLTPVASPTTTKNSCTGKSTPILKHGQSATLTVSLSKSGLYEFLCTVTGHAAAGMKGLLGVGVAVTSAQETTAAHAGGSSTSSTSSSSSSSGGTTTTTRPSSGGGGSGDQSGCPPGTTIKSSGATDADGDELGTEPDDNDGCV